MNDNTKIFLENFWCVGVSLTELDIFSTGRGTNNGEFMGCSFPESHSVDGEFYYGGAGILMGAVPPAVDERVKVLVDYDVFYYYLEKGFKIHIDKRPQNKSIAEGYMAKIREHMDRFKKIYPLSKTKQAYYLDMPLETIHYDDWIALM